MPRKSPSEAVHPVEQQAAIGHLVAADFELRVASAFACVKGTPAADNIQSAIQQAQCALSWIRAMRVQQLPMEAELPPVGEGIPLTRKQRTAYRWP